MTTTIIILFLLTSPLLLAFCISRIREVELDISKYSCWGLGIAFIFFFTGHFILTQGMIEMLPPWVPFRLSIVYLTGVLELFIGVSLFIPRLQGLAAKIAILVLIGFFPVNIYAAINGIGLGGHQWGPVYLFIRAPLQITLIAWAYYLCIKKAAGDPVQAGSG